MRKLAISMFLLAGSFVYYACGDLQSMLGFSEATGSCETDAFANNTLIRVCIDYDKVSEEEEGQYEKTCKEEGGNGKAGTWSDSACETDDATASCEHKDGPGTKTVYVFDATYNSILKDSVSSGDGICRDGSTYEEIVAASKDPTSTTTVTSSCAITAKENEGTEKEMDISGCWEFTTSSSSTADIKSKCEDGTLNDGDGSNPGTFSEAACSADTGVPYCKDFPSKFGGTGSLYYTGKHYVDSGVSSISSWCSQVKGTEGTTE